MTFINAVVKSPQRRTKEKRRFSLGRLPPEACRTKRETDFAYFRAHWKRVTIRGFGKRLTLVTLSSSRHSCFQEPISTPLCFLGRQGRCLMNPTGMCKLSAMPRLQGGCSRKASPKVEGWHRGRLGVHLSLNSGRQKFKVLDTKKIFIRSAWHFGFYGSAYSLILGSPL